MGVPIPADRPGPSEGLVTYEELALANRSTGSRPPRGAGLVRHGEDTQLAEQPWNLGGFGNNRVQRVPVTVV